MKQEQHLQFLIGTYTDAPSESGGITQVYLNPQTGELHRSDDLYPIRNPSYLTQTSKGVYSFSEIAQAEGAQLVHIDNGMTTAQPIRGDYPCHVAVSNDHHYLAIANYGSGNVCVYRLDANGVPREPVSDLFIAGKGPNLERQKSPHAHQVVFLTHTAHLASVDLGSDSIHFYCYDNDGQFTHEQSVQLTPGSGPRHLVFNQQESIAYVICELSETLVTLTRQGDGKWCVTAEQQALSDQECQRSAAAIHLSDDERYVYLTCRAQSRIAIFDVSEGAPKAVGHHSSKGEFPRDFAISQCGEWLVVANQHSNNVVSLKRDKQTGLLSESGFECRVDAPVCVVEIRDV